MLVGKDIKKLSQLARVQIDEKEEKKIQKDLANILELVSKLKEAPFVSVETQPLVTNVLRQDVEPYEAGFYSQDLLKQAPATEKGFVKVKNIFNGED